MKKTPAFSFYSNDFEQGVKFFNFEQIGMYVMLMIAQHHHGHLTEEEMLHVTKGKHDKKVFSKFISDDNGKFYNKRLEEIIKKGIDYSISRSENRSGKTISHEKDMKDISRTGEIHMENEIEIENEIEKRREKFLLEVASFKPDYSAEMLKDFYLYWSELNRSKTKMRYEMQKTWELGLRLKTWHTRSKNFKNDKRNPEEPNPFL